MFSCESTSEAVAHFGEVRGLVRGGDAVAEEEVAKALRRLVAAFEVVGSSTVASFSAADPVVAPRFTVAEAAAEEEEEEAKALRRILPIAFAAPLLLLGNECARTPDMLKA